MIRLKTEDEIRKIRKAAKIVYETLEMVGEHVQPGVSLSALDQMAEKFIVSKGAIPGFKGLYGFPATLCLSPNDMVVHGIPNGQILQEGDIISVDCGAIVDGYYGDAACTFAVGEIDSEIKKLMDVTRSALEQGIAKCQSGNHLYDIGYSIQSYCESFGFGVVRELVGHGIGTKLHEDPQVPNYGVAGTGPIMKPGLCLAIEPMINAGGKEVYTAKDGWAVHTMDGKASAHFEHTVAITENGPVVLSQGGETIFDS